MNRTLFASACCILAASGPLSAAVVTPGSTLTTGANSDGHSLYAATLNPAVAAFTIDKDERWRVSYFPSISVSNEIGNVNDFLSEIDDLIDILDDPSLAQGQVEETRDRFNNVLGLMGDEGYVKFSSHVTAPIFPLYWQPRFLPGTLFSELSLSTQVKTSFLDDELFFDQAKQSFATASSAYIKSGIQTQFALGYAQELLGGHASATYGGKLYGGVKASVYQLDLSKQVIWLQELDGEDIQDFVRDEYGNNLVSTTNLGIDLGLAWVAGSYRTGLTIKNINSPAFSYGPVGVNCEQYADASFERNNCEAAAFFADQKGDIKAHEKHVKHISATIDGTYYLLKNWSISGSADMAPYDDIVGTENQWVNAATSVNTRSFWIPDVRLGFHKNLVGSGLSTVAFGLSLFDAVTLDLEMGLDQIEVDGNKAPRKLAFSFAVEEKF